MPREGSHDGPSSKVMKNLTDTSRAASTEHSNHGMSEFPEEALASLSSRGRMRIADRGLTPTEILKSPRFVEACYRLGLRPSEVDIWHTQDYSKTPQPEFPSYTTLDETDLPLDWRISCLAEALNEYDTIMVKSSYANTQSFDEWMQGKNLSTTGGSQRGRSLDRTLRSITTPDDFATTAMARMRSHMARLEKQKASFMDNEARRERARSRSAQRKKERDELIYQRMMEMLDKERRQQMCFRSNLRQSRIIIRYRQRMEQLAEATKRMRDAKRGDRFKRNKDMQEHNRDQLLQVRKDREMRLSEALAARAESRRAKRAALLSAERSRLARLREKVKDDERRKMALTEEMRAKDTRSKDQLHRNKMEFEAFVQETHRKRAISEHLVERRRRREQYLKDAEADRQVLEAACDIEMERMTLAMKRQRVEYDRRKFQTNFEAAKKDKRPKSAASLTSLLPSINHHSVLPRSPQWSLAPRLSTPRGYDSGLGPGSYDIPSTLGADQIGPRWAPDSVDRSELAERPVRYEPPPPSSPPRSPSMSPILRPVRGNDGPGPGHRHEPVSVHRLPRPRDPKAIAE
ncbi:conserved hypothetical protein [Perkinsus marinus ATCC 50983]|uniref:Uncharacterized protein n=1 Tax=Perkinsus marinus (strain ATCC 50983 / TXsc) TaxID=423536 RepID=C5K7D8_PERM5|nr:conserved hypothetical protein [Perkinsus marinus ATCC 50983]EER19473.1 conserved hypothetical protein [Perkinsus marinus ATCC 50983]|eukprot:XP_002787677.1 conserved hypothetical protein [Perkinsus marinus ATCC 50983]